MKTKQLLIVIAAFLIGHASGWALTHYRVRSASGRWEALRAETAANSCLAVLEPLRSGDTGRAIDRMERQMNDWLLGLSYMRKSLRGDEALMAAAVLLHIKDYRAQYPFSTGSSASDLPVQQALSMVKSP